MTSVKGRRRMGGGGGEDGGEGGEWTEESDVSRAGQ